MTKNRGKTIVRDADSPSPRPADSLETLGVYLRILRKRQGLTIKGAAQAIKVSSVSFTRWEHGTSRPRYDLAQALDRLLSSDLIARYGHMLKGDPQTNQLKNSPPGQHPPQLPTNVREDHQSAIHHIREAMAALHQALDNLSALLPPKSQIGKRTTLKEPK